MPRRIIDQLPQEVRAEIQNEFIKRGFARYDEIADWITNLLEEKGLNVTISRSTVALYGKKFREQVMAAEHAVLQARHMAMMFGEGEAGSALSESGLQLSQALMFQKLINEGQALDAKSLASIAKAMSEASRGYVNLKRYQVEVRDRAQAAAARVREQAQNGGLSETTIQTIEAEILGIVRDD